MTLGYGSWCKACLNERKRQEYASNREKHLERCRLRRQVNPALFKQYSTRNRPPASDRAKGHLLKRYWPGISWREALIKFNELIILQSDLCAICFQSETKPSKAGSTKKIRDLCVDHCHITGEVRGLLCDNCNTLIARAKDTPEICISAAEYLRRDQNEIKKIPA